jgi:hypothetical protein
MKYSAHRTSSSEIQLPLQGLHLIGKRPERILSKLFLFGWRPKGSLSGLQLMSQASTRILGDPKVLFDCLTTNSARSIWCHELTTESLQQNRNKSRQEEYHHAPRP